MEIRPGKTNNKKGRRFRISAFIIILVAIFIINGFFRSIPEGTSYESSAMKESNAEFIYDLTYEKQGRSVKEYNIFKEQLKLIEDAENFIIIDMFLFNDDYNRASEIEYPNLSGQLTTALIDKKKGNPNIKILFITDEINNFYGVYETPYITKLKDNKIDVVITNLEKIRDSNPSYAGIWRTLIKWFGTSGKGWLPNAFSSDSPKVTLRGYLKLLNFKANHRKVIVTDKAAIVASMNPHDASGNHSNIGLKFTGEVLKDLIESELEVARFSGHNSIDGFNTLYNSALKQCNSLISVITEGKIRDNLIEEIQKTEKGESITIGMFYLGHRKLVKELINAGNRGVNIKLILDANKDAFGLEKDGIPNRPVAHEMIKKTDGKIKIRWYNTKGEQFHTKITFIEKKDKSIIIGGSANLTRRNLDNYNLETNVKVETLKDTELSNNIKSYFNRIWNNNGGNYTLDYEEYEDKSILKTIKYRIQEWSGLSSF